MSPAVGLTRPGRRAYNAGVEGRREMGGEMAGKEGWRRGRKGMRRD